MTPEYLCSKDVTERDKAIAIKSAFHALKRTIDWEELQRHLEYLRHANLRWGSCDPSDSRIHAFLKHDDTRTLASPFATHAVAARIFPFPTLPPTEATVLGDPFPLGVSLHKHLSLMEECRRDMSNIDEMSIDAFSKTLWKDTIRSNCSYLETIDAITNDIKEVQTRCSKVLPYVAVLYKESQRYAACDPEEGNGLVEWSKRLCGALDGLVSYSVEPCKHLEVEDSAAYMASVIGFHNAISEVYTPLPLTTCAVNSPLEIPCIFMMRQYEVIVDLLNIK
jgi:hypothetical protein